MLRELSVQNLALIEDVRVELEPAFCAWTGETGAGKSLLLAAIGLLLGERGSAELIRAGQEELRVTGRFELTRPEQRRAASELLQYDLTDEELVLTRRLTRAGRSSALVNEQPIAITTLRRLGEMLVDVHGQRESYSLLQPSYQLELLDSFGKLIDIRDAYQSQAEEVRQLRSKRNQLLEARTSRQRDLALLQFEREELRAASLKAGELEQLNRDREKLIHAQSLANFSLNVANRLGDDELSVSVVLGKLIKESAKWASLDKKLGEVAARLAALKPEIQDLADTSRDLAESFEADPARLEEIEKRLQLIKKLETKYSKPFKDLIAYRDSLDAREAQFQQQSDDLAKVSEQLTTAFAKLKEVATELSRGRGKVAKKLVSEAQKQLVDLGMPRAKLEAQLEQLPWKEDEVPESGIDQLEILLTANPGEPARPLRKVASGGELSRTMLALKTVLAAHDPVRTLVVFDEIDSNVGGRLGDMLGSKLAKLGYSHQVLCVTHLPQVACYAKHQWTIRKQTIGKRTATTIKKLDVVADRIEELSLMLRGEARSETTKKEAAEMLKAAQML
jgi:DNA repair protein RecN (Recombination protein N)